MNAFLELIRYFGLLLKGENIFYIYFKARKKCQYSENCKQYTEYNFRNVKLFPLLHHYIFLQCLRFWVIKIEYSID